MLTILKGIGILLLILLALVLLLLLLILLAPIRYRGEASFRDNVLGGGACVSWPAGIFRFTAEYDHKQLTCRLKFLWFELWGKPGKKKAGKKAKKKSGKKVSAAEMSEKPEYPEAPVRQNAEKHEAEPDKKPGPVKAEASVPLSDHKTAEQKAEPEKHVSDRPEKSEPVIINEKTESRTVAENESAKTAAEEKHCSRNERNASEDISREDNSEKEDPGESDAKENLLNKLQNYWQRFESFTEDADNRKTMALLKKQIGRLLKHVLPRKLQIKGIIGFEDPDLTGRTLGWIYRLYPLYGEHIKVQGSFDKKELEGDISFSGHIRLGTAAVIIIRVLMNRNFRQWIRKLKEVKNG